MPGDGRSSLLWPTLRKHEYRKRYDLRLIRDAARRRSAVGFPFGSSARMNLIFRLLWLWCFGRFRSPVGVFGPCYSPFRCLPSDLDVRRHMNNCKYFSTMDLASGDLMNRAGLARKIAAHGLYPVVAGQTIRFRKSILLWQAFDIESCVLGWDDKAFLVGQAVQSNRSWFWTWPACTAHPQHCRSGFGIGMPSSYCG
jgi:acyl-CoA thioesterase FadM